MKLIDTHTHIYQNDFDEDITEVIEKAKSGGVYKFLIPNVDVESIVPLNNLCDQYPGECFPMMGLHPTSINDSYPAELSEIKKQFELRKYIAVGEIGIDLYWDKTFLSEQKIVFEEQLRWSIDYNLPVVIHTRDAFPEVMECINRIGANNLRGIFHSFGGSIDELEAILLLDNFLIGINGVVTFKNSKLKDYLAIASVERIVLETDAPYLAPVPYRGKRNEPAYLLEVAKKLAEIYQIPIDKIAEITTRNALKLFFGCEYQETKK